MKTLIRVLFWSWFIACTLSSAFVMYALNLIIPQPFLTLLTGCVVITFAYLVKTIYIPVLLLIVWTGWTLWKRDH